MAPGRSEIKKKRWSAKASKRKGGTNEPRAPSPKTTGPEGRTSFPPGPATAEGAIDPSARTTGSDVRPGTTLSPGFVTREGALDPSPTTSASEGREGTIRLPPAPSLTTVVPEDFAGTTFVPPGPSEVEGMAPSPTTVVSEGRGGSVLPPGPDPTTVVDDPSGARPGKKPNWTSENCYRR